MTYGDDVFVITGGGRNSDGDPIPLATKGPFDGTVNPLRSSESVKVGQNPVVAFYRAYLSLTGGALLTSKGQITHHGRKYTVQGDVEPWRVRGRLHHYEATVKLTP